MLYSFENDYSECASPEILAALAKAAGEQNTGYGLDPHCAHAAALIRAAIGRGDADVHFVAGGTQINTLALESMLRPYQAVISADTGHICVHETGAIESTGHKIIAMPNENGKLTPERIQQACGAHAGEHMVQPAAVYISDTTEIGTVYTLEELRAIRTVCDARGLYLYIDGARLGCALTSEAADYGFAELAEVADAFSIGGTKNGLFCGEAYVVLNPALKPDFRYLVKRRGALAAKGFVLGIQFETLFETGLFYANAKHANIAATRLEAAFAAYGARLLNVRESNQLFVYLGDLEAGALARDFLFLPWDRDASGTSYRFVTSWATPDAAVDQLRAALMDLKRGMPEDAE